MKWLVVGVSFGISYFVIVDQYIDSLVDLDADKIITASMLYIVFYSVQSFAVMSSFPSIDKTDCFLISNVGYMVNTAIPFQAGEMLKVALFKAFDLSWKNSLVTIIYLRIIDLFVVIFFLLISIILISQSGFFLIASVLVFVISYLFYKNRVFQILRGLIPPPRWRIHAFIATMCKEVLPLISLKLFCIKFLAWTANFIGFFIIFHESFMSAWLTLFIFCIITLGLTILVTPFGVGQVQVTLSGVMSLLGSQKLPESLFIDLINWQLSFVLALFLISVSSVGLRLAKTYNARI